MIGEKQTLLAPRFCRRCGGSVVRTYDGYRCVECGTAREPTETRRDFVIVRPSQRQAVLTPVPMAVPGARRGPTTAVGGFVGAVRPGVIRMLGHARSTLMRAASDFKFVAAATSDWIHPRYVDTGRRARVWGIDRVAQTRETITDLADREWQLDRSIPGFGSSAIPIVILAVAIVLALGLGGAIAAALS